MRVLFYLPDRIIGGPAPPASQIVSPGLIRKLRARGLDMVAYAAGCRVDVPFLQEHGPDAPATLIRAVDELEPELAWSYIAWEPWEIEPCLGPLRERGVPYVQSMTDLPWVPTPGMAGVDFLCESRLARDLLPGFKSHLVRPFVPFQEAYSGPLERRRTHDYLYMHNLGKGIDFVVALCREIPGLRTLYVTAERSEVEAACGGPLPGFVRPVGRQTGEAKRELLRSCDAAFYASPVLEAIGMSAIECMLSGVPVLAVPRTPFGRRVSLFQYLAEGEIPAVVADSREAILELLRDGALDRIDRREVRERAVSWFDNDRSADDHAAVLEAVLRTARRPE